jgi:pSer/pThr/pTyr-binding forkhead associated (FHA) protein
LYNSNISGEGDNTAQSTKKFQLPMVPKLTSRDRREAIKTMSEWVKQMHILEGDGLHRHCKEWTMFLSSSDSEFGEYCQSHSIPKPLQRQKNIEELSECVKRQQKEYVADQHAWFGAVMGSLDGTYDHSKIGVALGSSLFKRDQFGGVEMALTKMLLTSGATEPDKTLVQAVRGEIARHERNQQHWNTVRDALLASKMHLHTFQKSGEGGNGVSSQQQHERTHSISLMGLEQRDDLPSPYDHSNDIDKDGRRIGNKHDNNDDLQELYGAKKERKRRGSRSSGARPRTASRPRTESLSNARLVARLVPPHLISGHHVPLSSAQQSSKQNVPEVYLFAGQVVTLGRDVGNDIQIRDAAASRRHGLIEVSQDGRVFFVDVGSSNGTEVDMIHISTHGRVQLKSGSRIRIGDTYYFCLLETESNKEGNSLKKIEDKREFQAFTTTNRKSAERPVVQLDSQQPSQQQYKIESKPLPPPPPPPPLPSPAAAAATAPVATPSLAPVPVLVPVVPVPVVPKEKTPIEQMRELLQELVSVGKGHYTDARNAVSKRFGPTFFKKNRSLVREMLEELKNELATANRKALMPETGADALLRDLGLGILSTSSIPSMPASQETKRETITVVEKSVTL